MIIKIDGINRERKENELIVYTNNEVLRNAYGYEFLINEQGFVVEKASQVNLKNNYKVISVHGSVHEKLEPIVELGTKLQINEKNNTITLINDEYFKSKYIYNINLNILEKRFNNAKENNEIVNYSEALILINEFKKSIDLIKEYKENSDKLKGLNTLMNDLFERAYQSLTVSEIIEARGVWHRPKEKSLKEIEALLNNLEQLNINDLYVETFWNGFSIYPSEVLEMHPIVKGDFGIYGNDYLKALITEAEKRDIDIHAWVENFFVGISGQTNSRLWEDNPNWQIINYNGLNYQTGKPGLEEEGFLFFDPSNQEVQDFIINFYKELVTNYNIKGLQLDYIRYPAGNTNYKLSSGYTNNAINLFKANNNFKEDIKEYVKDSENYQKWNDFRVNVITNFVNRVYSEIMSLNPNLLFSIAVGPNASYAKDNLMQDWKTWVQKGIIDIVAPMAYVRSSEQIKDVVDDMNLITKDLTYNYTGVSPTFDKLPDITNTYFIDESRKSNALGNIIFAYHNLEKNLSTRETLIRGTHREKSVRPHDSINKIITKLVNVGVINSDYLNTYNDSLDSLIKLKEKVKELNLTEDNLYNKNKLERLIIIINIKINRKKKVEND